MRTFKSYYINNGCVTKYYEIYYKMFSIKLNSRRNFDKRGCKLQIVRLRLLRSFCMTLQHELNILLLHSYSLVWVSCLGEKLYFCFLLWGILFRDISFYVIAVGHYCDWCHCFIYYYRRDWQFHLLNTLFARAVNLVFTFLFSSFMVLSPKCTIIWIFSFRSNWTYKHFER